MESQAGVALSGLMLAVSAGCALALGLLGLAASLVESPTANPAPNTFSAKE